MKLRTIKTNQKKILLKTVKILKEHITDKIKDITATKISKVVVKSCKIKNNVDNGGKKRHFKK